MLVELIKLIHIALIIAICLSVFIPNKQFKKIMLAILILLLIQYATGYGRCGLTELEYLFMGEQNYKSGFIYRMVNPVITIPESYLDSGVYVLHLLIIIILVIQIN